MNATQCYFILHGLPCHKLTLAHFTDVLLLRFNYSLRFISIIAAMSHQNWSPVRKEKNLYRFYPDISYHFRELRTARRSLARNSRRVTQIDKHASIHFILCWYYYPVYWKSKYFIPLLGTHGFQTHLCGFMRLVLILTHRRYMSQLRRK